MKTFAEFWPLYVGEPRRPITRALHFCGRSAAGVRALPFWGRSAGVGVGLTAVLTQRWVLRPLAVVQGYAWAWAGHFGFEKNRPATFKYPLWSLAGDWKMWALMLAGRMGGEVKKLGLGAPPAGTPQGVRP